ncbi:ROK family protein [Streptomyces chiangmaiensis]|uniref:ROK family protein n=1 Tax=Streptomyces chiangmaiensis TaxID=766497 RepID=A0ABU7FG03_9ACTN|nr:ROK family protein [Streptomyces chiangmaiensis]MED7823067.1 ROK family protein [Streptomyces chiangmaiensis]
MSAPVVVALDIGGTTLAAGLVAADGIVLHSAAHPAVRGDGGRDPGLAGTVAVAREMTEAAATLGAPVVAIGAGFPEYVADSGRLTSREVLDWAVQPARLLAPLAPGRPVTVESDVRCGALAEARLGAGRGLGSFLYVSLGTGLSAAFVQNGQVWAGRRGEALALGAWEVPASVDPDFSAAPSGGRTPTLEEYVSGAGIAARYASATGAPVTGAREVASRAAAGDGTAAAVLTSAGRALGTVLAWAVALLDPDAVLLGGGLGTAGGLLHDTAQDTYAAHHARPDPPPVRRALLGDRSGLLGAALAVWERHELTGDAVPSV